MTEIGSSYRFASVAEHSVSPEREEKQRNEVNLPFDSEYKFISLYFIAPYEKDTEITAIYSYSSIFNITARLVSQPNYFAQKCSDADNMLISAQGIPFHGSDASA